MAQRKSKIRKEKTGKQVFHQNGCSIPWVNYYSPEPGLPPQVDGPILTEINTCFLPFMQTVA